jgi:hypothetical protein
MGPTVQKAMAWVVRHREKAERPLGGRPTETGGCSVENIVFFLISATTLWARFRAQKTGLFLVPLSLLVFKS